MAINVTNLLGSFINDPELHFTPDGIPVVNFILVVQRPRYLWTSRQTADFIKCISWRSQARLIAEKCKKGSSVIITGRLQSFSYVDADGVKHHNQEVKVTEINIE